jgi:diguanylate cyclase (GGDEF)-like protein
MHSLDPARYEQLKASGQLPSPKGVALAVVRLLQRDDYEINDLVRLVQSDPAIAGELLKFSNAAAYGQTRPIVSLSKAVTTLGTLRVRVLVLALSVLHNNRSGKCPQFDYERFWSRALATAIAAQALASYAKITPDENFTAGLLCRIGELALASIFPDRYGEIIAASDGSAHKRIALEREVFDTDHRELGATLLLEWGLPEVLVTAIYYCEFPDDADFSDGSRVFLLTQSLHVALALAEICVADERARWAMLPNLFAKAARLGIHADELNSMGDSITASWMEWGKLLKIQTREITSFADLLASSPPREQESASPVCKWPGNKSVLLICTKSPESAEITSYFEENGYAVKYVSNATKGLSVALEEKPDLILIELSAPEIDGLFFCRALRGNPLGRFAYIILVANQEDADLIAQALDMGADDFLQRPISTHMLHAKLRGAFKILQLQNELIKERNGFVDSSGKWAGINRRLINVAMTDPLTQLPNRRHGLDFLSTEWVFAKANNLPLACLMIDIDHFKTINDQNGHKAGDKVLEKLAKLLQANARSGDLVFRYGGEEFCMICPGAALETARAIAERIRQSVEEQHFQLESSSIAATVSIGVAVKLPTHANGEALIHDADTALYRAKESGRNRVSVQQAGAA